MTIVTLRRRRCDDAVKAAKKILALGPVSRILFLPLARDLVVISLTFVLRRAVPSEARLRERRRVRHTRDCRTGRPVAYFALHQTGFFVPPTSPLARWALTPPFHPYPERAHLAASRTGRYILCDTVRHRALKRGACARLAAGAASCPVVSGLSSPNYRARHYPRLGIKELGATTRPQS